MSVVLRKYNLFWRQTGELRKKEVTIITTSIWFSSQHLGSTPVDLTLWLIISVHDTLYYSHWTTNVWSPPQPQSYHSCQWWVQSAKLDPLSDWHFHSWWSWEKKSWLVTPIRQNEGYYSKVLGYHFFLNFQFDTKYIVLVLIMCHLKK